LVVKIISIQELIYVNQKSMHALIKFAQMRDFFVCDFVAAIKVC
jgi:hypothetical protein